MPTSAPHPDGEGPPTRPLVLVVDDSRKNLRLACDVLRAAGLGTLEAVTGGQAIALARSRLPDVILMDLRLPDMDGTQAVQSLAADSRTSWIPVVALSALPHGHGSDWLRAASFAGRLDKPIDVTTFADDVRGYCASGGMPAHPSEAGEPGGQASQ